MNNKTLIPTLNSIPRQDMPEGNQIFCKYCLCFHLHGIGDGHRTAHCNVNYPPGSEDSPYNTTGYRIKRIKNPIPKEVLDIIYDLQECMGIMRAENIELHYQNELFVQKYE